MQLTQKAITRETLRELLRLADAREKAAIDVLARQYRVQVYESFWSQQEEYKERQAALDRRWRRGTPRKRRPHSRNRW